MRAVYKVEWINYQAARTKISWQEHLWWGCEIADIADNLAYLNHDIDDGLTSGCITSDDLMESDLWRQNVEKIKKLDNSANSEMFKYQIVKELIDSQAKDLLKSSMSRLEKYNFQVKIKKQGSHNHVDFFNSSEFIS